MPSDRAPTLRLLAAASTGALLAASFRPHGLPALAWLAVAPLWVAARGAPDWRAGLRLGLVAGLVTGAIGYPWMIDLFHTFGELDLWLSIPLFGVFAAWTAAPLAAWAAMVSAWTGPSRHVPWVMSMALPGLWWSWPMVFPFTLAMGLAFRPAWIQAAELGGVALVEVPMLVCGALLGEAWRARGAARLRLAAVALVLPLASFALGSWRMAALAGETVRTVAVGLVQPNIPLLWSDRPAKLERLREPSARAEAEGAALVVWPENMFPWTLNRPFERDFSDDDRVLRRHALPTVFGAGTAADSDPYGYNSVIHMAADGRVLGRYDKIFLVPLGEEIPLVDPEWAKGLVPGMAHNFRGEGPGRLVVQPGAAGSEAPPLTLGPLVCYEDVLPTYARAVAGQPGGIEAFVNLTNDTWFGATAEPRQHLALSQFRAVEHRIPLLRAVNSGPSSLVDRTGQVVASTDVRAVSVDAPVPPEHLVVQLELGRDTASAPTIYARFGWLFGHVCQASVVVVLALLWRRRKLSATARPRT
ncbi:apolipoprotein N-acyltransferase [Nannocystis bainbridge]|uniref:Apolipoprotein N-acyltransferase n=1 Tax=Nannocystis bainbridge TaxID=2995303 RepID=A0ABT5DTT5_9BACT|nr:apolipoprotein N-acyltransferase [Nannocystis bainbridge]MDC0717052.1 apolipoprotein N-acyltransferase [Nannocystis bainbridge]